MQFLQTYYLKTLNRRLLPRVWIISFLVLDMLKISNTRKFWVIHTFFLLGSTSYKILLNRQLVFLSYISYISLIITKSNKIILEHQTFLKRIQNPVSSTAVRNYSRTTPTSCITLYIIVESNKKNKNSVLISWFTKTLSVTFPGVAQDYFYAHLYLLKAYVE